MLLLHKDSWSRGDRYINRSDQFRFLWRSCLFCLFIIWIKNIIVIYQLLSLLLELFLTAQLSISKFSYICALVIEHISFSHMLCFDRSCSLFLYDMSSIKQSRPGGLKSFVNVQICKIILNMRSSLRNQIFGLLRAIQVSLSTLNHELLLPQVWK